MRILTTFWVVLGFCAQIWANEARITRLEIKKQASKQSKTQSKGLSHDKAMAHYLEQREEQNKLLFARTMTPHIWEGNRQVLTGKTYRAILLNSVVSSNLASPMLVKLKEGQGLSHLTKFACHGVSLNLRVHAECHRMILPNREIEVKAQILNLDGSAGLLGVVEDGKEDLMAASLASNFAQGALSMAQSRISTPFGDIRSANPKNQIYQGLIQSGSTASDIYLEELKNITPTVTVQAGTEVLIYFQEAINEADFH
jgi:hypothetical protein